MMLIAVENGLQERHALYKKMGLRVELDDEGNPILTGRSDCLVGQMR